jgi:hypothetical protein
LSVGGASKIDATGSIQRDGLIESAWALGRLDLSEVKALDGYRDRLHDFLDGTADAVVRESRAQDGVSRRDLVKGRDEGVLVKGSADGADDLL